MSEKETIQLLNINQGMGNARMGRKKYEIYRNAILGALSGKDSGLTLKELGKATQARLPRDSSVPLGKLTWHIVTVKLDLEARGEIERVPGAKPQRLRLCR